MTVSKSLGKLVALELVRRVEHEADTRAKNVSLTDKGKAFIHTLVPIVEQIDAEFFGKMPQTDQQTLIQILAKLTVAVHVCLFCWQQAMMHYSCFLL